MLLLLSTTFSKSNTHINNKNGTPPYHFPRTPVCLFKKKGQIDPKVPWSKKDMCEMLQYTNSYNIYTSTFQYSTTMYKIAHACNIPDPQRIKYKTITNGEQEIIDMVLDDHNQPSIGACSSDLLEEYILSGHAEYLLVDGKTCHDPYGYFLDVDAYIGFQDDDNNYH